MKQFTIYWRFKGKRFLMMPWNSTTVNANTKKEAALEIKDDLENVKVIRVQEV